MSDRAVMPLSDYVAACDKVREKTETTEAIKSGELSEKIDDVYEAGKKAERDKFWDTYQGNGNRTNYSNTLGVFSGYAFNFDNFYPKYDIRPTDNAKQLFYAWTEGNVIGSLSQRLKECGVVLDTSSATTLSQMFNYTRFTELPAISFENVTATAVNDIRDVFANNPYLETIEKIIVTENTCYRTWFGGDTNLKNVIFEGVIGQNGLDFSPCTKFSAESCHSIFTHLKDFRTTIVENYADTANKPCEFAIHTLTEGDKYYLIYESNNTIYKAEATVQNVDVGPSGISAVGLEFEFPQEKEGEVPLAWVYQDGEKLMYDAWFYRTNGKFTLIKGANETRTITMPKAVKDNGNATPEDIKEATDRGWTIAWKG